MQVANLAEGCLCTNLGYGVCFLFQNESDNMALAMEADGGCWKPYGVGFTGIHAFLSVKAQLDNSAPYLCDLAMC